MTRRVHHAALPEPVRPVSNMENLLASGRNCLGQAFIGIVNDEAQADARSTEGFRAEIEGIWVLVDDIELQAGD